MALSDAHLRYLFAISNAAAATPDVSSRQIASALGVTKPSVVHILNILMRDGMVVKRHYGKIYLTDRGAFTVNYYRRLLDATLAAMPEYPFPVSADERRNAALALIAALPDRDYREHFGALFAETEVEKMSRSQKVNEPETMSTASAYLYKEQAECVQQVRQYLVEHLDSHVTQAELAQRYHISLTSLKGAFKQVYGLPINTYLRRCRVQHAEQLLFTTDLSILEIAQRVGYDSPSRFAAMFKREKGITPRECRRVRTDQLPEEKTIA